MNCSWLTENQRKAAEGVCNHLLKHVVIPSRRKPRLSIELYADFEGEFEIKINSMLHKKRRITPAITTEKFNYTKAEIGNVTGFQFLYILYALCENHELASKTNCVVLTINSNEEAAFVVYRDRWIELTTPTLADRDRGYYRKLFDGKRCEQNTQRGVVGYDKVSLNSLRQQWPSTWVRFLENPVMQTSAPYRYAGFGLLFEIAKLRLNAFKQDQIQNLPIAALIWISVFIKMPQLLQAVFGDHYVPVKQWASEFTSANPDASPEEVTSWIKEKKMLLRKDAAYEIISK